MIKLQIKEFKGLIECAILGGGGFFAIIGSFFDVITVSEAVVIIMVLLIVFALTMPISRLLEEVK